jgi:hypothetical protein
MFAPLLPLASSPSSASHAGSSMDSELVRTLLGQISHLEAEGRAKDEAISNLRRQNDELKSAIEQHRHADIAHVHQDEALVQQYQQQQQLLQQQQQQLQMQQMRHDLASPPSLFALPSAYAAAPGPAAPAFPPLTFDVPAAPKKKRAPSKKRR